jgi:plastocyanin
MGPGSRFPSLRASACVALAAGAAVALSACTNTTGGDADLVAGKKSFAAKCGSCHVLNRAGTKGAAGPDLDQAFQQSLRDGFPRSSIEGIVHDQILYPASFKAEGAKRADDSGAMPAKIVTGDDAVDVAAYVAAVVGRSGKDTGLLATAVPQAGGGREARARNGTLSIPADPNGQLAYATNRASAPAGDLKVQMPNRSGTPHDIVIDGKGKGEVVQGGGTSEFEASFDSGSYTYYCSVPGHREAGMQGRLTVR